MLRTISGHEAGDGQQLTGGATGGILAGLEQGVLDGATGVDLDALRQNFLKGAIKDYYDNLKDNSMVPAAGRTIYSEFELDQSGRLRLKATDIPITNALTGGPLAFSTIAGKRGGCGVINKLGLADWRQQEAATELDKAVAAKAAMTARAAEALNTAATELDKAAADTKHLSSKMSRKPLPMLSTQWRLRSPSSG